VPLIVSDYIFHPPSGSSVPGKEEANKYIFFDPKELRQLVESEKDIEELAKIKSALKQWERQYIYPGYPFRAARELRRIASILKKADIGPAVNVMYYRDCEIPEGYDSVLQGLLSPHDNYNNPRFDYNRQGERPFVDMAITDGDFLTPHDAPMPDAVKPRGDGPDPLDEMLCEYPPTGADRDTI
jgi:hypothetical protein